MSTRNYVMVCGHCHAHVELPSDGWLQGRVIDWFISEHVAHLADGENICVLDHLAWACLHAAAFTPTDPFLQSV